MDKAGGERFRVGVEGRRTRIVLEEAAEVDKEPLGRLRTQIACSHALGPDRGLEHEVESEGKGEGIACCGADDAVFLRKTKEREE